MFVSRIVFEILLACKTPIIFYLSRIALICAHAMYFINVINQVVKEVSPGGSLPGVGGGQGFAPWG